MDFITNLEQKYSQASKSTDAALPYKYIPGSVTEISNDLKRIKDTISTTKDTKVQKLCKSMQKKLEEQLQYFENKLKNIPNKNYMQESDEEWVDENMPN